MTRDVDRTKRIGRPLRSPLAIVLLSGIVTAGVSAQIIKNPYDSEDLRYNDRGLVYGGGVDLGERLLGALRCIACHKAEPAIEARLETKSVPLVGNIGARINPEYLQRFIRDPHSVKPNTLMPNLFTGVDDERTMDTVVHSLTQFFASLGGPMDPKQSVPTETDIEHGRILYHQVGCVACHEPFDPPSVLLPKYALELMEEEDEYGENEPDEHLFQIPKYTRPVTPMANLAAKTDLPSLTSYLKDPLTVHPSGWMPDMKLSEVEAKSIASFLLRDQAAGVPAGPTEAYVLDPKAVDTGKFMFAVMGCAECHEMGPNRTPIQPVPRNVPLKPLAQLNVENPIGCLGETPRIGAANYNLTDREKMALKVALVHRKALREPLTTGEIVHRKMVAFNCYACHTRNDLGGPESVMRSYFTSLDEADLGDEGRFAPHLNGVGAKLMPGWLHDVLANGATMRPYVATRMPQYGEDNVAELEWAILDSDTDRSATDLIDPPFTEELAMDGRTLVGLNGMSCIECHAVAGNPSRGTPGPDLAKMHERLRPDWFRQYMPDPGALKPGTRMPTFWPKDQANAFPEIQNGDPGRQVDAIWAYLSRGEFMPLPEGIESTGGYELMVSDEPLVLRTFMSDISSRAIAVGYPEQVHVVFDAARVRLAKMWKGRFLNAAGAWAGRGGSVTNPTGEDEVTLPAGSPWAVLPSMFEPWPTEDENAEQVLFSWRGYELDDAHRPTFLYDWNNLQICEHLTPIAAPDRTGFSREFTFAGTASSDILWFRAAVGEKITQIDTGVFLVDGRVTIMIPKTNNNMIRPGPDGQELIVRVKAKDSFKVEITW